MTTGYKYYSAALLAMRVVLYVQQIKTNVIGDVADRLKANFGVSRAQAYRYTAYAFDALGRHGEQRPRSGGATFTWTKASRARMAATMTERWKDPAFRKRMTAKRQSRSVIHRANP